MWTKLQNDDFFKAQASYYPVYLYHPQGEYGGVNQYQ